MKAQELRIGNWVEFMGKDKQITQEIFNEICENNATALEIPLTEEWLLKFGLKRVLGFIYKNKEIEYNLESHDLLIQVNNHNYMLNEFKYVHQLQNLYFSLVGEELETKTQ